MTEPVRPPAPRLSAAPWGFLGMLALLLMGEWAFSRVEMDVLSPWHWDWRHTGKAAGSSQARGSPVLCFGDSLVKFGVLPTVVESITGRRAYNLALAMGQPPSSYFLLRRVLRAGARPSAVLVDAAPFLLRDSPLCPKQLRQWPEMLGPAEALDLAWSGRSPDALAATAASAMVPSLRARQEIRTAVRLALSGERSHRRYFAAQYWRNARVNRGANAVPPTPLRGDLAGACRTLFGAFVCDPLNERYLDRFLDLASAYRIRVYFILTPLTDEVQAMCDRSGFDAAHTEFVRSLQRRHPGLTVLDGRRCGYGQDLHTDDPAHLNSRGAIAFSAGLAPVLARALAGRVVPRWVTLPSARAPVEAFAVEDVNGSALAINRVGRARR